MMLEVIDNRTQQQGLDSNYFGELSVALFENDSPNFDDKKLALFVGGGISYTEIYALRERKETSNIIIATDTTLSPKTFLDGLRDIDIL